MRDLVLRGVSYLLIVGLLCLPAFGKEVTLEAAYEIPVQILEDVTSKKKSEFVVGSTVKGEVWQDVIADGRLVIEAGTPVVMTVTYKKKAKVAGRSGKLTIEAKSTTAVDGTAVDLVGGYGSRGKGRKGAAISAAVIVAWPLVFIRGKQAKVPSGTVVLASIARTVQIDAKTKVDAPPTWDAVAYAEDKKTLAVELLPLEEEQELPGTIRIVELGGSPRTMSSEVDEAAVARFDIKLFKTAIGSGKNYALLDVSGQSISVLLPPP